MSTRSISLLLILLPALAWGQSDYVDTISVTGAGSHAQCPDLTSCASHYECVDEAVASAPDGSYFSTIGIANDTNLFVHANTWSGGKAAGAFVVDSLVVLDYAVAQTSHTWKTLIRQNGAIYGDASTRTDKNAWAYGDYWTTQPVGGAWTADSINTLQFGHLQVASAPTSKWGGCECVVLVVYYSDAVTSKAQIMRTVITD